MGKIEDNRVLFIGATSDEENIFWSGSCLWKCFALKIACNFFFSPIKVQSNNPLFKVYLMQNKIKLTIWEGINLKPLFGVWG